MRKMSRSGKRRWFQFSLKSLLGISLLCGILVAWVSLSYQQYRVEQDLIESIVDDLPSRTVVKVSTNGHVASVSAGAVLM